MTQQISYDELIALAKTGDRLIEDNDQYEVTDEGLVILGQTEPDWSLDLRIKIVADGFIAHVRDPTGAKLELIGKEWTNGRHFAIYDEVVTWAYMW